MTTTNHTDWYRNVLKAWQVKHLGSKPTDAMLEAAHAFGKPGKQSLALAMAMRPEGVTAGQIIQACGAPQNNHRRAVIEKGYFKREPVPASDQGHTVYKVALTAKGNGKLTAVANKVAADAVKAGEGTDKPAAKKPASKPRKPAKPAPVETPAEPATLLRPDADGTLQPVNA